MALPHSIFLGLGVALRITFPEAVRWVTYDTPVMVLLSVWYPFISTLLWVHNQRHRHRHQRGDGSDKHNNNNNSGDGVDDNDNDDKKKREKEGDAKSISERKKVFENNKNKKKTSSNNNNKDNKSSVPEFVTETVALATTKYWLNYWQMYAVIQASGQCWSMIPIIGRFLTSHPIFNFLTGECKLFFFIWVFGMERILGNTTKDAFLAEALPLRLIQQLIMPLVLQLHNLISDAISKEFWQRWVVSKTKTALDIVVMVRMLSEEWRDWLLHIAEEARVLTLPSITLLMPGFVTQFGVAYVQYIVPSSKSAEAKSNSMKLVYLQYWILHCAVAGLLTKIDGILWWVPFSTHAIFLLWSYLILPQAIRNCYGILESELFAFGILPKSGSGRHGSNNSTIADISETKTVRLFNSVLSRLPSAATNSSSNGDDDDTSSSKGKPLDSAKDNTVDNKAKDDDDYDDDNKDDDDDAATSKATPSIPETETEIAKPLDAKESRSEISEDDNGMEIKDKDV